MKGLIDVDLIKFVALGCEFFASFMLSLLLVIQGDERSEAISAIVLSVALPGVAYIVGAILCFIYIIYNKGNWLRTLLIAIGGLLYFVGDNLPPVMEEYGAQLSCGVECLRHIQAAGFALLAIALITYLPSVIDRAFTHDSDNKTDSEAPVSVTVFTLLASLTELDLAYTAIERMSSGCPHNSAVISAWVYWSVYVVAFLLLLILAVNLHIKCKRCFDSCCSNIHAILIFVCLAAYLLADNMLPLSCTGSARVNLILRSEVRIGLWAPALAIAFYALFFTIGWKLCCKKWGPYPV